MGGGFPLYCLTNFFNLGLRLYSPCGTASGWNFRHARPHFSDHIITPVAVLNPRLGFRNSLRVTVSFPIEIVGRKEKCQAQSPSPKA